jgi:hypothetical protein
MGLTYFMPVGNPSALNIGDTLKVTLTFSNIGVNVVNSGFNIRFGVYNYSAGGTRATDFISTSGANGNNVQGYMTLLNFGQTFGQTNGFRLSKRTLLDANLMGSTGEYTTLNTATNQIGDPGFSNNVVYTMVFSMTRTNTDAVVITNSFTGPGLNIEVDAADTSGAYTNFDCFAMRPANNTGSATNMVFTEFKVEGPPGILTPPVIVANPSDMTLTVSDFGLFSAGSSGSGVGYQWYFNNTSTPLANQTNQNLWLTNVQLSQAGGYFMVASNSQASATTTVATLTVNTATHTPRGTIVDDTFQNNSRVVAVTPTTSDWVSSTNGTLTQPNIPGPLVGYPTTNAAVLWVGNFIDTGASGPVDLAVGDALRVTLVFTPTNPAPQNTGSLRFGVYDFYDGGVILNDDGNVSLPAWGGSGGGTNARGYMLTVNFGTSFSDGTPLGFSVRTNLPSPQLMSSGGDYLSMGSGPSGMSNAPGFQSGSQYTLQMTAARMATTSMQVSAQVTGPQLSNLGFLATDNTYFTHRFSGFGIRPNRNTDSADAFTISRFKAEVIAATSAPISPFLITAAGNTTATNFFITWNAVAGKFYQIESATNLTAPIFWQTNTSISASGSSVTWTNLNTAGTNVYHPVAGIRPAEFYRVVCPPQP